MSERQHLILGIVSIGLILGSGGLMSAALLKADRAQIDRAEWEGFKARLDSLEAAGQAPASPESSTGPATESRPAGPIPVNTADQNLLEELPGIGPVRAQAILDARSAGPFRDLEDFRARTPTIPKSVLEDISTKISFE